MSSSVKVLSDWRSLFGVRVLIALKVRGVEYEYMEEPDLLYNKSKLLLESNPVYRRVPVLFHNGKPICESLIIVQYIDETWPSHDKGFLPQDPYERSLVRFWADYVDKKVYEGLALILGESEQGRGVWRESMVTLDGALRDVFGPGPYFGGEHLNLVDITLGNYLSYFATLEALGKFKLLDESSCPHLCAWATAMLQCQPVKEALAIAPPQKVLEAIRKMKKDGYVPGK